MTALLITISPHTDGGGTISATMVVHFIEVGHGAAVFVKKDRMTIMYDCGDTFAGPVVSDYLAALGVRAIDLLIVSHGLKDHMGGCIEVLNKTKVRAIYYNGSQMSTGTWAKFLKAAREVKTVIVEKDIDLKGVQIIVAYDTLGRRYSKEADNSILVRLIDTDVRLLLTGGCEAPCEKELIKTTDIQSDILNVANHGSNASSSWGFLKKVKPKVAVIQVGSGNQYGHPMKPVLRRLRAVGAKVLRTDCDGSVVILSDGRSFKLEQER